MQRYGWRMHVKLCEEQGVMMMWMVLFQKQSEGIRTGDDRHAVQPAVKAQNGHPIPMASANCAINCSLWLGVATIVDDVVHWCVGRVRRRSTSGLSLLMVSMKRSSIAKFVSSTSNVTGVAFSQSRPSMNGE
eukprot:TRINITY_DN5557_c0_g2_i1.p2 TRINITY_DN5557_c0_g2~~TRINITY_DN5557_c0_g2_i1.p2  ORF type:complete len:132 (+),score=16.27 TRINITY_DN5557_c0_g2_i1:202-597(+)